MDEDTFEELVEEARDENRVTITVSGDGWRAASSAAFNELEDPVDGEDIVSGGPFVIYTTGDAPSGEVVRETIDNKFDKATDELHEIIEEADNPVEKFQSLDTDDYGI
jgi:hypothetical protein